MYINSVYQLISVMVKCGVLFEVRTGILNIVSTSLGFKGLRKFLYYINVSYIFPTPLADDSEYSLHSPFKLTFRPPSRPCLEFSMTKKEIKYEYVDSGESFPLSNIRIAFIVIP
jgi:hypothetical protein